MLTLSTMEKSHNITIVILSIVIGCVYSIFTEAELWWQWIVNIAVSTLIIYAIYWLAVLLICIALMLTAYYWWIHGGREKTERTLKEVYVGYMEKLNEYFHLLFPFGR